MTDIDDWTKESKKRFSKKVYTPVELNNRLIELEKKYGDKMATSTLEDMDNKEEKLDKIEYEAIVETMSASLPDWKKAHENYKNSIKIQNYGKSIFSFIKSNIWVVVAILLILAILKYLMS